MPPRKTTAASTETSVLAKSARRCALCFFLKGDLSEKLGQIAHFDQDPSNSAEDNLAFMCLEHHSQYDSRTSQHKNYTTGEVKTARARLYDLVTSGEYLSAPASKAYIEADRATLGDLLKVLPSTGSIKFLREKDFGYLFKLKDLDEAYFFLEQRKGPEHEFLDPSLEKARKQLISRLRTFLCDLESNTWPNGDWQGVDRNLELTDWPLYTQTIERLNRESTQVCKTYDTLIKMGRKKLGV